MGCYSSFRTLVTSGLQLLVENVQQNTGVEVIYMAEMGPVLWEVWRPLVFLLLAWKMVAVEAQACLQLVFPGSAFRLPCRIEFRHALMRS